MTKQVRLKSNQFVGGENRTAGDVVETDDAHAEYLIKSGNAEEDKGPPADKPEHPPQSQKPDTPPGQAKKEEHPEQHKGVKK